LASLLVLAAATSAASAAMHWGAPANVATPPGEPGVDALQAISCPSTDLCVAAGPHALAVSSDPAAGVRSWKGVTEPRPPACTLLPSGDCVLEGPPIPTPQWPPISVRSISCPTTTLCVGVGSEAKRHYTCPTPTMCESSRHAKVVREILTSTDPTGGPEAWKVTRLRGKKPLYSVACPTATECVALSKNGTVLSSSNPLGGAKAWKSASLYPYVPATNGPNSVTCAPGGGLCVATGEESSMLWARKPLAGILGWEGVSLPQFPTLLGVACASPTSCIGYGFGTLIASTNLARGRWSARGAPRGLPAGLELAAGSCAAGGFCAVGGGRGSHNGTVFTNPSTPRRAWRKARVDNVPIRAISCPTATLCVAVDSSGRILTGS
jgi:hypothetical protein